MHPSTIVILLLGALAVCAQTETDAEIERQVVESAGVLVNQTTISWQDTARLYVLTNDALDTALRNISALYPPSNSSAIEAIFAPERCTIVGANEYALNATASLEFMCCHVRRLRVPGLQGLAQYAAQAFFFGGSGDDPTATRALANLAWLRGAMLNGYVAGACKDDRRLHDPQQSGLMALAMRETVAGPVKSTYDAITAAANNAARCIGAPTATTGCRSNTFLSLADFTPNINFILDDPAYQEVCTPSALGAFELARVTPVCA